MPNACAGITARHFQHSPAHSASLTPVPISGLCLVTSNINKGEELSERNEGVEEWGGGKMRRISSETQLFFSLPREHPPLHSLVCGSQPHLLLIKETYPGASWGCCLPEVFFPALHFWFVFYCSGNIRHSQNKMTLQQHMD